MNFAINLVTQEPKDLIIKLLSYSSLHFLLC